MDIKFQFDQNLKKGNYSSKYFLSAKKILKNNPNSLDATLKFFNFTNHSVVCGTNECIQLIKFCLTKNEFSNLSIWYKKEGELVKKYEPVLVIRGDYKTFGYLENIIDGILSRRSSVATNTKNIIDIIGQDKLIFMADRSDDYTLQKYDGYSAYIGGARNFVTKEQIQYLKSDKNIKYIGTIPHAVIQQYNGNLAITLKNYIKKFKGPYTALIDYHNDCIGEIDKLIQNKIEPIDFIRIDTSKKLIDKSLSKYRKKSQYYGINKYLINKVRNKLDEVGWNKTKIIVSSGLTLKEIQNYSKENICIDYFGVGKSLLSVNINYSGDLIKIGDQYESKKGREMKIESYLATMNFYNK